MLAPMKSRVIATLISLALVLPALACPGAKNMQNADAGTAQSERPAEAAAATQTPMPAADAPVEAQPAEVAAVPAPDAPTTKN